MKRIDQKKRKKKWKEKVVGFEQHCKYDWYHPDRKTDNIVVSYMPQRKKKTKCWMENHQTRIFDSGETWQTNCKIRCGTGFLPLYSQPRIYIYVNKMGNHFDPSFRVRIRVVVKKLLLDKRVDLSINEKDYVIKMASMNGHASVIERLIIIKSGIYSTDAINTAL